MLKKFIKPSSKKLTFFLTTFVVVKLLVGIGFFIGWKSDSFYLTSKSNSFVQQVNKPLKNGIGFQEVLISDAFQITLLLSIVCTLLFCWTFILLIKSKRDQKLVEESYRSLKNELEKGQKASNQLNITHQQLSSTSGQLDGIVKGTTDFIATINKNYQYISFNDSYAYAIKKLFGAKIELGMKVNDSFVNAPEKLESSLELWTRAINGETFTANQEISLSLDKTYYFELTFTPIKNDLGEIVGATQICKDVTERILTAEKLKYEKDFVSAIFNVNSSLIMVLDREGRIVRFNEACENKTGYTEEEVKGKVFWNILVPTQLISKVKNNYKKIHTGTISSDCFTELITKNEEIINVSWQVSTIKDETGTNEFVVATGIDITEKIDSEMAQKRMLEILENSSDLIRISDLNGKITYINPAGRAMLGISENTDITKLKISSCHPKWANELMNEVGFPTAVKRGSWLGETAIKTFEGKDVPTSQLILAHSNNAGIVKYFSTVVRDTSSQKALENDLEKARDKAIESTKLMSSFLANMSHEIRTPMNGILGLAELLQSTDLDSQQKDYVDTILFSGEDLLTIINDILDFSKLKAGKLKFINETFDLQSTLESTIDLFAKPLSKKQNLELSYLIDPKVPIELVGDQGRIRQVLVNLISNAIKFTDKGSISIQINVEELSEKPILHFSIKDTGIGISKSNQEKLFNPFSQADSSISSTFGGTGLGLAISKQLVSRMDGKIGVESEPDKGSTFWFTAKFATPKAFKKQTNKSNSLKNIQILIAIENEADSKALLTQTKLLGMYADETNSHHNALSILKKAASNGEPFSIILIDETLDGKCSLKFTEQIKDDTTLRDTEVVLLYSDTDKSIIEKAKLNNINYFISKPVEEKELLKILNNICTINDESESAKIIENKRNTIKGSNTILENNGASTMNLKAQTNARILIAEDNLVNQKVILNQVTGLGYEVDLAENGREVLDALQLKDYSLILMDCQMPIMDGFEATQNIRKAETGKPDHIPIIAVTAHALEGDRERCLNIGMDDYISKPTKQQVLAEVIETWLNKSFQKNGEDEVTSKSAVIPTIKQNLSEQDSIDARLAELEENCGKEIVLECINLFLEDTANVIVDLTDSQNSLDFQQLAKDAHKLKGSAANMGSSRMPKLCQKLIEFSMNEQSVSTKIILKHITDEYEFLNLIYMSKKEIFEEELAERLVSA